jgi:hypothetical protein
MFKSILGKIKEKDKETHNELAQKIMKMDLSEKKNYVNDRIESLPVSREGLIEVMNSLIKEDSKTKKRYIKMDDSDAKKKKGFDLVITISTHKYMTLPIIDLIQDFSEAYRDIIEKYDTDNKQTYEHKLKKAVSSAVNTVNTIAEIHNTNDLLKLK